MNKYLEHLYEAFDSVDEKFFFAEALKDPKVISHGSNSKEIFIQLTERQFGAELYRMWRNKTHGCSDYANLMIGFEVSKKFVDNEFVKDKKSFVPDLILHQSQSEFDPNYQIIYIEIKTRPSLNLRRIKHDLNKTLFAMKQYQFQHGVFISVNSDFDNLQQLIANYIKSMESKHSFLEKLWKDYYLFHSDEKGHRNRKSFEDIKTEHNNSHRI